MSFSVMSHDLNGLSDHSLDGRAGQIFDLKRFATHDGPGIRTTVFFTRCPLRCAWCHNPEAFAMCGSGHEDEGGKVRRVTVPGLISEVERDIAYYDRSGGGVTVSGGEPLAQPEFIQAFLAECRKRDLRTAVDTSGCVEPASINMAAEHTDLILYDLKSIDNEVHTQWTGKDNKLILENLLRLNDLDVEVWIRLPLIPKINDTGGDVESTIAFLKGTRFRRVSLLPYHRIGEGKYRNLGLDYRMSGVVPQSPEEIERVRAQFAAGGFAVHIGS